MTNTKAEGESNGVLRRLWRTCRLVGLGAVGVAALVITVVALVGYFLYVIWFTDEELR